MKMPIRVLLFAVLTTLVISAWLEYFRHTYTMSHTQRQVIQAQGETARPERLANGIAIRTSYLPEEQKQILRFMDANATRITLDDVPTNKRANVAIVIRRRGKPDTRSVMMNFDKPLAHEEYTVCIIQLANQKYRPDKLKIIVEAKTDMGFSSIQQIIDNPFKDCNSKSMGPGFSEGKTGITLMTGVKEGSSAFPYAEIGFEISSQELPIKTARFAPTAK